MLHVVVEELIPEMSQGQHSNVGTVFFAVGFSEMCIRDSFSTEVHLQTHLEERPYRMCPESL